jgi:hypothetical protein
MLLRLARLALAAVLLVAWQAALQHPIEHVDGLGELVHVHSGHAHDEGRSDEPDTGSLCDLLAALTACAAQAAVALAGSFSGFKAPEYPVSAPRLAEAPPFLSQGPPASV